MLKDSIEKIISGGQTGADKGGLIAAAKHSVVTGGVAPKDWKTETGKDITLKLYNLIESKSTKYRSRTLENIKISDCTLLFADKLSVGSNLTENLCLEIHKPFLKISNTYNLKEEDYLKMTTFLISVYKSKKKPIVINIAGNRESKSLGIEKRVEEILSVLMERY